jgi:predicted Zn-dependent protease
VPLPPDYRLRLRPTALGWPILKHWCVWVEPPTNGQLSDRWQQRWREAVDQALGQWAGLLPLQRVDRAEAAQILLLRRRTPRQLGADGRLRASHGRALLSLRQVDRGQGLRLEPLVHVALSPDQRAEALQATALHELGHGLGLWGHSESNDDVMAARPGPKPILRLSERDRATLAWLYSQSTRFGQPLTARQAAQVWVDQPLQASGEEIKR